MIEMISVPKFVRKCFIQFIKCCENLLKNGLFFLGKLLQSYINLYIAVQNVFFLKRADHFFLYVAADFRMKTNFVNLLC